MYEIWTLAAKDLKILTRDRAALFFIVGLPVVMGLFFGFVYRGVSNPKNVEISCAIVDNDQSTLSQAFIEQLDSISSLRCEKLPLEEAQSQVRGGQRVALIVIPAGFGETAGVFWAEPPELRIERDPSRAAEAGMLAGNVMEAMGKLVQMRMEDTAGTRQLLEEQKSQLDGLPPLQRLATVGVLDSALNLFTQLDKMDSSSDQASTEPSSGNSPAFQLVKLETTDAFKKSKDGVTSRVKTGWDLSLPSAVLWGVMGCAAGFAISLVREQSRGTLTRLRSSPTSTWQLILGKSLACYLTILFVFGVVIAMGCALGMRPESPVMLAISGLVVAYCFVGIMMAMSVLGRTEEAVGGAGWAANMVMAMFGGAMIPLAFMPQIMKSISHASPVKWAILSFEGAIWRGFEPSQFVLPWSVLLAVGTLGLIFGATTFQRTYSQG